jgi:hypothetical protein
MYRLIPYVLLFLVAACMPLSIKLGEDPRTGGVGDDTAVEQDADADADTDADSDADSDSDSDSDSDADTDTDPVPEVECVLSDGQVFSLTNPYPVTEVSSLRSLYRHSSWASEGWGEFELHWWIYDILEENEDDYGCPTATWVSNDTVVYEGDCGGTVSGTATYYWGNSGVEATYDRFSLAEQFDVGLLAYSATGAWTFPWSERGDAYIDLDEVREFTGDLSGWLSGGTFTRTVHYDLHGNGVGMMGRVSVHQAGLGDPGEFCVEGMLRWRNSCDDEPQGDVLYTAGAAAVLSVEGRTDCDGCGTVTIDGQEAGSFCEFF